MADGMTTDRFTQANAYEAVEKLKNIHQTTTVHAYIDLFEECVQLVRRDHPYVQEAFIMGCFIGGLRADIKHDVSGQRSRGILEAYGYAKVYENSAAAKKALYQTMAGRPRGPFPQTTFKFQPPKQIQHPSSEKQHHTPAHFDRHARQCWYC
jgi:hypothetical protein